MLRKIILYISIALCFSTTLAEDVTTAFLKCANTPQNNQRLACYDNLYKNIVTQSNQPTNKASQYIQISLADLKADIQQLNGKKIETSGKLQIIGNLKMVMLKTDDLDMTPIMTNAEKLPREDRKKLLNACQMILCNARIIGTIKHDIMGHELVAEKIVWQ